MLHTVSEKTEQYLLSMEKDKRKAYGQFFTDGDTAKYMAGLFHTEKESVSILDPGSGNGMLAAAAVQQLITHGQVQHIELTVYENDPNILSVLKDTLSMLKGYAESNNVMMRIHLHEENFILANREVWKNKSVPHPFDVVICNPPYKKIPKTTEEAIAMADVVHGQPNLYFLFMAMSANLLAADGQMVFITPRSWLSGLYFEAFRSYFLDEMCLTRLHIFRSRNDIFRSDNVLQETIIFKAEKRKPAADELIVISSCNDSSSFETCSERRIPYQLAVTDGGKRNILLPADEEDIETLNRITHFTETLEEIGFLFKTGPVVEFRNREWLHDKKTEKSVPLLHACNIVNGDVQLEMEKKKCAYFEANEKTQKMMIANRNTILVKRFTTKEEHRRLQPGVHIAQKEQSPYFTIENHVNYLCKKDGSTISPCEIYGIYVIMASKMWDRYYRILDGSTQVNAAELNAMPVPPVSIIRKLGSCLMEKILREEHYDVEEILGSVI